jgi:predicted enzyme related to lactoylglutathione lyase
MPQLTRFENIMPEMPVKNLSAAIDFYSGVLGFRLEHLHGDEYAVMRRENSRIGLFRASAQTTQPGHGRLYAFISGIDEFYAVVERMMKGGGKIVESLADRPYGLKDFAINDPDGNRLGFGQDL